MSKEDWSAITEEQLATLFPILLEPHNPAWKTHYLREKARMEALLGEHILRVSHIGSTSVPGLLAKPTVDLLLEVAEGTDLAAATAALEDEGYVVNHGMDDLVTWIHGYTPRGFEGQTAHIHVRHSGDWGELYFRDYLILHEDAARAYEALKCRLKERFPHDRDGYTAAKGDFVREITRLARVEFPQRYAP